MKSNGLKTIDIQAFYSTQNLQVALFAKNELTLEPPTPESQLSPVLSPFHACGELKYLDLSHNNVSSIFEDWMHLLKLEALDLSYNKLQVLRVSGRSSSSST